MKADLHTKTLISACVLFVAMPLVLLSFFSIITVPDWLIPIVALVTFLVIGWLVTTPLRLLLRDAKSIFAHGFLNAVLFVFFCVVYCAAIAVFQEFMAKPSSPLNLFLLPLGLIAMAWMTLACWLLILHGIGFVLCVGRRLPFLNRAILYCAVAGIPAFLLLRYSKINGLIDSSAFVFIGVIFALAIFLAKRDFNAHPPIAQDSIYDPLAIWIARVLGSGKN